MKTLEEIKRLNQDYIDRTKQREIDLQNLKDQRSTIDTEISKAVEDGNVAKYRELKAKAAELEEKILFCNAKKIMRGFTDEELTKAWSKYADEHDKTMRRKYEAFCKAKSALCAMYEELVTDQDRALHDRYTCAEYVGIPLDLKHYPCTGYADNADKIKVEKMFPLDCLPTEAFPSSVSSRVPIDSRILFLDAKFPLSNEESASVDRILHIVQNQLPSIN